MQSIHGMSNGTGDGIEYDGYSIDERSQIIIQVLRDLGETTAGDLANEVGLDDTSSVHQRHRDHLGPNAAGLIDRSGTKERSGGQPNEILYDLTDEGGNFAEAYGADLVDAVAAAEAVDTLRRIHARVDGFDHRVTEVEDSVEGMDAWKNRWSTRVGRVESTAEELESGLNGKADAEFVEERFDQHESWSAQRREEIKEISERVEGIERRLDRIEQRLGEISEELDDRPTRNEVGTELGRVRDEFEQQIEDVRESAERLFGGRL